MVDFLRISTAVLVQNPSQRRKGHWTQTCLEISVVKAGDYLFCFVLLLLWWCWLLVVVVVCLLVGWLFDFLLFILVMFVDGWLLFC